MPVEHAADHPTFELGDNTVTSFAAPARGAYELALYRVDIPPAGGLPAHRHDHLDVFVVVAGGGVFHLDDEAVEVAAGDSVVVPVGVRHTMKAGAQGASFIVTMVPGNKMIRDDGSELVPDWVR